MADEEPRARAARAARELVEALAAMPTVSPLRVTDAEGRIACLIQVWDARTVMPTAGAERHGSVPADARDLCRADILEVMRATSGPKTRKEIVRALKDSGKRHGPSTVAKALADLTKAGELGNPQDKKGYRLKGWKRDRTPSLFD